MTMDEQQLRAIHAQACAAVARTDRAISPVDDRFWPIYLRAALIACDVPQAALTDGQRQAIDDAERVLAANWEHETADRLREAFAACAAVPTPIALGVKCATGGWAQSQVDGLLSDADRLGKYPGKAGATLFDCARVMRALLASHPAVQRKSDAERDVLAERARQIAQEGWTPEHDDKYRDHEMSCAAACYAMYTLAYPAGDPPPAWPWAPDWWKPTTHRRNLVKAAALLLAEIDRLDRAGGEA
ncbi:hypothetical protein [Paraburkholderia guartelaensis]|uniref:Uncharacterized protein n=1 Tax=Paraburkholderia guartelaensis TaxID=2546446 RepID=A0ABU9SET3_9BURK